MNPAKGSQQQDQILSLGQYRAAVDKRLDIWESAEFAQRFWEKDPSIWFTKPQPEITNRMGWLDIFEPLHEHLKSMFDFAESVKSEGFKHVVLMGMGGSSLAPEVFQHTFGNQDGYPRLILLDSTHPDAVRNVESQIELTKTIFVVSSKSGTTTETLSFYNYFWARMAEKTAAPGINFVAITDPGTPLMKIAAERGFRRYFDGHPDIGGRYSALTYFGLVPAAMIGIDSHQLLDRGWDMAGISAGYLPVAGNPSLILGAALGELALAGRDKITFFATPSLTHFSDWIEQLIAESTGKNGKGIVPVIGEDIEDPWVYRKDRVFVYYALNSEMSASLNEKIKALENAGHPVLQFRLNNKFDMGQEIFRWEMAVASAGAILGIHPFNQPDVQLAKEMAHQVMDQKGPKGGKMDKSDPETVMIEQKTIAAKAVEALIASARQGDYFSIQAYLAPNADTEAALQEFRLTIRDRLKLATTFGWGPRFLHSTGQLHKGGQDTGVFIQLIDEPTKDLAVPETNYTFGGLIHAQALGDYRALKQRGRRVLRLNLGHDAQKGLSILNEILG
jgi:transaldolase / glucose-6-phosphate isomerase